MVNFRQNHETNRLTQKTMRKFYYSLTLFFDSTILLLYYSLTLRSCLYIGSFSTKLPLTITCICNISAGPFRPSVRNPSRPAWDFSGKFRHCSRCHEYRLSASTFSGAPRRGGRPGGDGALTSGCSTSTIRSGLLSTSPSQHMGEKRKLKFCRTSERAHGFTSCQPRLWMMKGTPTDGIVWFKALGNVLLELIHEFEWKRRWSLQWFQGKMIEYTSTFPRQKHLRPMLGGWQGRNGWWGE